MTVKQAKEELDKYPDHMVLFVGKRKTEFDFGQINSIRSKEIPFSENPGDKPLARDTVVVFEE